MYFRWIKRRFRLNPIELIIRSAIVLLSLCAYYSLASHVPETMAPDEYMRNDLSFWIYEHGSLPIGDEAELINPAWGFSYGFLPYFPSMLAVFFMKLEAWLNPTMPDLFLASRMVSVLSGVGIVITCLLIGDQLFNNRWSSCLLAVLVGFLPQFAFLCSYQNNDTFAIFGDCITLYFLIRGHKKHWNIGSCIGLSIGLSMILLTYYMHYGWFVISVLYCVLDCWRLTPKEKRVKLLFSRIALVAALILAMAGWFFIRNAVLHNGDFLGRETTNASARAYAAAGHDVIFNMSMAAKGISFKEMLIDLGWLKTTLQSSIGIFGYMNVYMPNAYYQIYYVLISTGCLFTIGSLLHRNEWTLLKLCLLLTVGISFGLSLVYSYTSDFQPQGRYTFGLLAAGMMLWSMGADEFGHWLRSRLSPEQTAHHIAPALMIFVLWLTMFLLVFATVMVPALYPADEASAQIADDGSVMTIRLDPVQDYSSVTACVCYKGFNIDGLNVPAEYENNTWTARVNMSTYNASGTYTVHLYATRAIDGQQIFMGELKPVSPVAFRQDLVSVELQQDCVRITLEPLENYGNIIFNVWNEGAAEPHVVEAMYQENSGTWHAQVPFEEKNLTDWVSIQVFTDNNGLVCIAGE